MSKDKEQAIKRVKRKAANLKKDFKNGNESAVKFLISNNLKYKGMSIQNCLKKSPPHTDFLHAVVRERGFDSYHDMCNSDDNCFVYDYLIYFYEYNESYQPNARCSIGNDNTKQGREYVGIQDIISIYKGQDRHSSMITFRNGRYVCAKGSPSYMIHYLCNKKIPKQELEPFDNKKCYIFRIDSRLFNPANIPLDVYDSYKIDSKADLESENDFKDRVYDQFKKYGYMWVRT